MPPIAADYKVGDVRMVNKRWKRVVMVNGVKRWKQCKDSECSDGWPYRSGTKTARRSQPRKKSTSRPKISHYDDESTSDYYDEDESYNRKKKKGPRMDPNKACDYQVIKGRNGKMWQAVPQNDGTNRWMSCAGECQPRDRVRDRNCPDKTPGQARQAVQGANPAIAQIVARVQGQAAAPQQQIFGVAVPRGRAQIGPADVPVRPIDRTYPTARVATYAGLREGPDFGETNDDGNPRWFFVVCVVAAITVMANQSPSSSSSAREEDFENENTSTTPPLTCRKPTLNNPYMNAPLISEGEAAAAPLMPACQNEENAADDFFQKNLYMDVSDVFQRINSKRQFFTMPYTTVIPDPDGEFKRWVYEGVNGQCKTDPSKCIHEDVRQQTRNIQT
ncbi:hypothetical protein HDU98_010953 [Podochytrium sp. JEL0797]|nr:hypothetical protein HDU98_010953 [Podochytrium sp. JEL0797]